MLFSVFLSVFTIWTVLKQNENMSFSMLIDILGKTDKRWMIAAFASAGLFVFFEGVAICSILKGISYKRSLKKGIIYSTSDVYFSAITPSATGGQPASAYFMHKDGIPVGVASAALILNIMLYTASIVFLGIIAMILTPQCFFSFGLPAKLLIILGLFGLTLTTVFFLTVLVKSEKIFSLLSKLLNFLHKKKVIHRLEPRIKKLYKIQDDYNNCSRLLAGKTSILVKAFFWNVLQRTAQIIVPALVYLAMGGDRHLFTVLFSKQCLITIGYNFVPIPGAMGIADYLMIDGFSSVISTDEAFLLEMISRCITFYICVAASGLITLAAYLRKRKK